MKLKLLITLLIAFSVSESFSQATSKPKTTPQTGKVLAWDNLYFGMPRDTVENLIQQSSNPNVYMVGDYECRIYCDYNSAGLLNKITLMTVPLNEGAYGTGLLMWYDNIFRILEREFGSPTSNREYPELSKLRHGKTEISVIWKLKSKTVEMGMGKNYNDCFVSLIIYKNPNK